jgi:hypothetical protein
MRLLFCGSGWLPIIDQITARLPEGASLGTWDVQRSIDPRTFEVAAAAVLRARRRRA